MSVRTIGLCLLAASLLVGCNPFGNDRSAGNDPDAIRRAMDPYHADPKFIASNIDNQRVEDGADNRSLVASIFGAGKSDTPSGGGGGGPGIAVNSYLWRATLDTVSFMPLASADAFGGIIVTDWYSPSTTQDERFKVRIVIRGRELRAEGVRASVFRQKRDPSGQWVDAPVDRTTGTDLENAILTRARELRLSTAAK